MGVCEMTDNDRMNAYIWAARVAPGAVPLLALDKGDEFVWPRIPGQTKVYRGRGWYSIKGERMAARASTKTAIIKL